jgi:hypothetical protein
MVIVHLPRYEWNPKNITDAILSCRAQGGVPIFLTKYAGEPFESPGLPGKFVMMKCWGGTGPEISRLFYHVPEEDFKLMEQRVGDWKWLIEKYGPKPVAPAPAPPTVTPPATAPPAPVPSPIELGEKLPELCKVYAEALPPERRHEFEVACESAILKKLLPPRE